MAYGDYYGDWPKYVPVATRRARAAKEAGRLAKKRGRALAPIKIEGRAIARSFWGKAWCENLEAYSDFSNRLPRGRTYARNGSVIDLDITQGKITALVSGSSVYELEIKIDTLPARTWQAIQVDCSRSISSLIDLMQGKFDRGVMERLTRTADGLFPKPKEIRMECSCPDYAGMCKHVAAVMYGVGARLDESPELLFVLRNVDHLELIGQAVTAENLDQALTGDATESLNTDDLGQMFGIELETGSSAPAREKAEPKGKRRSPAASKSPTPRKATAKKPSKKLTVAKHAAATLVKSKRTKPAATKAATRVAAPGKPVTAAADQPRTRRRQRAK